MSLSFSSIIELEIWGHAARSSQKCANAFIAPCCRSCSSSTAFRSANFCLSLRTDFLHSLVSLLCSAWSLLSLVLRLFSISCRDAALIQSYREYCQKPKTSSAAALCASLKKSRLPVLSSVMALNLSVTEEAYWSIMAGDSNPIAQLCISWLFLGAFY